MEPSYAQIAELFGLHVEDGDPEVVERRRRRLGRNAEESEELGRECLAAGDHESGIRHFRRAVEQAGANEAKERVSLGAALEYADMAPQAWRQYTRAVQKRTGGSEPLVGLAALLQRHGRFRDAVEQLGRAIEVEPGNAPLYAKLAETLREMRERKRALVAAIQAVVLAPDDPYNHFLVGDIQMSLGEYTDALDSFRAALELSPGDDYILVRTAIAFWRAERRPEAVKAVRLASDLDPTKMVYRGLLAVMLEAQGLHAEAKPERESAKKMDRYDRDLLNRLLGEMQLVGKPATLPGTQE